MNLSFDSFISTKTSIFADMQKVDYSEIELKDLEFTVIDFETTGTAAYTGRAIDIGLVKIKNGKITDSYQSLINPECYIPQYITEITGITNLDVAHAPVFEEIVNNVLNFIGDSILVAHNMSFDESFLKEELKRAGLDHVQNTKLCTLKLSRRLYPDLPSKSLGNLVKKFRIRHRDVHRGLGDATVTAKLFLKIVKDLEREKSISKLSQVLAFQNLPSQKTSVKLIKKKIAFEYSNLPDHPGVYFFKDKSEQIIYIGKGKSLKKRVANYFTTYAESKAKKISREAYNLGYQKTNSELTALLAETDFIKIHDPKFNRFLKKYPQQFFVKVNLDKEYPMLKLSTTFDFDGNDYFGPYSNRDIVKTIISIVDKTFELRECTEREFSKKKGCYLKDINRCSAPCINNDKDLYQEELNRVYNFLEGDNQVAVNRLLERMKLYAENQKYEQAGETRDTVNMLLNQLTRTTILSEPINKCNVLIEINEGYGKDYILMNEGKMFIKDHIADKKDHLIPALEDYFYGTISINDFPEERHLEHFKISLSWLVRNKNNARFFYLKNYNSIEELFTEVNIS
ncbi:MAG: hypothetical protein CMF23_13580 [Ignavibacteriae bacterium]|nr:hypothetical protein [Ignavibacteriota bacterium]